MKISRIFQITGFPPEKLADLFNKKIAAPHRLKNSSSPHKPLQIGCYAVHEHQDLCKQGLPEEIQSIYLLLQPNQQICVASNDVFGEGISRVHALQQFPHPVFEVMNTLSHLLRTSYGPQAHAIFFALCEQVFADDPASAPHLCSLGPSAVYRFGHEYAAQYFKQHSPTTEHPMAYI